MHHLMRRLTGGLAIYAIMAVSGVAALAADVPTVPPADGPVPTASSWSFRFVPYGWVIAMDGTQTVRGRSVSVDASFIDILEKSDSLLALMGTFEARRGPLAFYSDVVWTKIGVESSNVRNRAPAPGVAGELGTSVSLDIEMAIVEGGVAYEVARSGGLALDVLGGARYWHQEAAVSSEISASVDVGDLELSGSRAFARSGSVDWIDPVIGARVRHEVAPGHELFLRGDIGGFGVGSDFSWQAVGGYGFEFGTYQGVTFSGVLGYRALSVDYSEGQGPERYEFDMLQHGTILGISARF